jgi:hypothetical protein
VRLAITNLVYPVPQFFNQRAAIPPPASDWERTFGFAGEQQLPPQAVIHVSTKLQPSGWFDFGKIVCRG